MLWMIFFVLIVCGIFLIEGPQAMLKGALLYGGMIYLLSGGMGGNQPLQQYTEQPVEF